MTSVPTKPLGWVEWMRDMLTRRKWRKLADIYRRFEGPVSFQQLDELGKRLIVNG